MEQKLVIPFKDARRYLASADEELLQLVADLCIGLIQGVSRSDLEDIAAPILASTYGDEYGEYFAELYNVCHCGLAQSNLVDFRQTISRITAIDQFIDNYIKLLDDHTIVLTVVWTDKNKQWM